MNFKSLSEIQEEAENFITGGMSSSFRANFYTGLPMYASKAKGPRFTDCTGKEFIDVDIKGCSVWESSRMED